MNMKLEKRIPYNNWMQAKQLPELLGWANCAYVATQLSQGKNFVQYLDGVFRSKKLGIYYFPCEMKFRVGDTPAYVALISSYLIFNPDSQTVEDFNEIRALKVNAIKNYIAVRSTKGPAYIVVVVQNNEDLVAMANTIVMSGILADYLPRIYFTGEGAFNEEADKGNAFFLQMLLKDEEGATPFDFYAATPDFLA